MKNLGKRGPEMACDPNLDKILKNGKTNLQESKTGEAKSLLHIIYVDMERQIAKFERYSLKLCNSPFDCKYQLSHCIVDCSWFLKILLLQDKSLAT